MQKYLLSSIAAAALAAATVAVAQPAPPSHRRSSSRLRRRSPMRVMQPQTRNGVVEKVREHFARLDTNRDGYLTKAEAEAGRAAMKAHAAAARSGAGSAGDRPRRDVRPPRRQPDGSDQPRGVRIRLTSSARRCASTATATAARQGDARHGMRRSWRRDAAWRPDVRPGRRQPGRARLAPGSDRGRAPAFRHGRHQSRRHGDAGGAQQMRVQMKEMHRVTRPS